MVRSSKVRPRSTRDKNSKLLLRTERFRFGSSKSLLECFALFFLVFGLGSCASHPVDSRLQPKLLVTPSEVVNGSVFQAKVLVPAELMEYGHLEVEGNMEEVSSINFFPDFSSEYGVYRAFVGVPYTYEAGEKEIEVKVHSKIGLWKLKENFEVKEGKYRSEILKVEPKKVAPPKEEWERIKSEIEEVGQIYASRTPKKFWKNRFALPVKSAVTSPYGSRRVYNNELKNYHNGLDLRAQTGTPVYSTEAGEVVLAKDLYFTGNTVLVDHGYGIISLYGHLSKIRVKPGQKIKERQLIGLAGETGRVTGPHLHWGMILHGVKVNPADFLEVAR